jgi:hypothetical protein
MPSDSPPQPSPPLSRLAKRKRSVMSSENELTQRQRQQGGVGVNTRPPASQIRRITSPVSILSGGASLGGYSISLVNPTIASSSSQLGNSGAMTHDTGGSMIMHRMMVPVVPRASRSAQASSTLTAVPLPAHEQTPQRQVQHTSADAIPLASHVLERKSGWKAKEGHKYKYTCTSCDYACDHTGSMTNHKKRHKPPTHECPVCKTKFRLKSTMDLHIKTIHEENKPYICGSCSKKFATNSRLDRHLKTVHSSMTAIEGGEGEIAAIPVQEQPA